MKVAVTMRSCSEPKIHMALDAMAKAGMRVSYPCWCMEEEEKIVRFDALLDFDPPSCLDLEKDVYTRP